jgi:hypothetical protein
MRKGYMYITSTGYDPEKGKSLNDPTLGARPTLGACMTNIRSWVATGDEIFFVSGKVPGVSQYVIGGFAVDEKIDAMTAYRTLPQHRLRLNSEGRLVGNIIVDATGQQHYLDTHKHTTFSSRIENYVVGRDPVVLTLPYEIKRGRDETAYFLRHLFRKNGTHPYDIMGRARKLDEQQLKEVREWLFSIKDGH